MGTEPKHFEGNFEGSQGSKQAAVLRRNEILPSTASTVAIAVTSAAGPQNYPKAQFK